MGRFYTVGKQNILYSPNYKDLHHLLWKYGHWNQSPAKQKPNNLHKDQLA